jgi:hypothetical protein
MAEALNALKEEIRFVKSLALQGRGGAVLGGWVLIAAGTIYGTATLFGWAVAARLLPFEPQWQGYGWLVATVLFIFALFVLNARTLSQVASGKVVVGPVSRLVSVAWKSVGFGIFTLILSISIAAWRVMDTKVLLIITPVVFSLYGMAWMVSQAVSGIRWMQWASYGCFLTALVVCFTADTIWSYPLVALGLFLFAVLPGIALVRRRDTGET